MRRHARLEGAANQPAGDGRGLRPRRSAGRPFAGMTIAEGKKIDCWHGRGGICEQARLAGAAEARLDRRPPPGAFERRGRETSRPRPTDVAPATRVCFDCRRCPATACVLGAGRFLCFGLGLRVAAPPWRSRAPTSGCALRKATPGKSASRSVAAVEPRAAPGAAAKRLGPGGHLWMYAAWSALPAPRRGRRR
jgi:hypothetical protein